jgi:hypothetical protein
MQFLNWNSVKRTGIFNGNIEVTETQDIENGIRYNCPAMLMDSE